MAEDARSRTSGGLLKRSVAFEPDVLRYLETYGRQINRPVAFVVRVILREWMDARVVAEAQATPRTPDVPALGADGPSMEGG